MLNAKVVEFVGSVDPQEVTHDELLQLDLRFSFKILNPQFHMAFMKYSLKVCGRGFCSQLF